MKALRTVVLTLMGVLVVGGCSEDPEPRIETVPSPSASETASSAVSPTPPESPEEFIQRWFDAGVSMQASGETSQFEALNENCDPCDDLSATVQSYYADGGYIRPAAVEVVAVKDAPGDEFEFVVETTSGSTTVKESVDAEPKELGGGPETYTVRLRGEGASWRMRAYLLELAP